MSVEVPKAFPASLSFVSLGLFYLAYLSREDPLLKYFFLVFGVIVILIAICVYLWDRHQYHKHVEELGILHGYPKNSL